MKFQPMGDLYVDPIFLIKENFHCLWPVLVKWIFLCHVISIDRILSHAFHVLSTFCVQLTNHVKDGMLRSPASCPIIVRDFQ